MASKHKIEVVLEVKSRLKEQMSQIQDAIKTNLGRIKDSFSQLKNIGKGGFGKIKENFRAMGKDAKAGLGQLGTYLKSAPAQIGIVGTALAGLTLGFVALVKAMKFASEVGQKFEQTMANINAILKPTAKEFEDLKTLARDYGKATAFSASEAGEAFIELGKLGLNTQQIMASAGDVLNVASASGESLAESAMVTASALGQFGLDASEAQRVTDVMSESFTTSALDMNKFKESMKSAGPVANATGVSLEKTTGALAVLSNSAIAGSQAGTAMKNILIEMKDPAGKVGKQLKESAKDIDQFIAQGKLTKEVGENIKKVGIENASFTDKLKLLKAEGLNATQVMEKFGRIAGTGAITLIENADAVAEYDENLKKANGSAKEMAEKRLNSIEGQTKLLNSAMEELGLVFFDTFKDSKRELITKMGDVVAHMTVFVKRNADTFKFWFGVVGDIIKWTIDALISLALRVELAFKSVALVIVGLFEGITETIAFAANGYIKAINLFKSAEDQIPEFNIEFDGTKALAEEVGEIAEQINKLNAGESVAELPVKPVIKDAGKIKEQTADLVKEKSAEEILAQENASKVMKDKMKAREDALSQLKQIGAEQRITAITDERNRELAQMDEKYNAIKEKIGSNADDIALLEATKAEELRQLKEQWRIADQEKLNAINEELKELGRTEQEQELADLNSWYTERLAIIQKAGGDEIALKEAMEKKKADIQEKYAKQEMALNFQLANNYLSTASHIVKAYQNQNAGSKTAAIIQRGIALGQITVNTARAVAEALPNFPLALSVGAMGSAQFISAATAKFKDGGVVDGSSMYGDKVPALVNSGEMILNRRQQRNLFDIANGGISSSSTSSSVSIGGSNIEVNVAPGTPTSEVEDIVRGVMEESNIRLAEQLREIQEDRLTA